MGYASYTVSLGDQRKTSGEWKRVTILWHQRSLPQAPDFIIFKTIYLFILYFCKPSISILIRSYQIPPSATPNLHHHCPNPLHSPSTYSPARDPQQCLSSSSRNIPHHSQTTSPSTKRLGPTWSVDQATAPSFAEPPAHEHPARNPDCASKTTTTGTTTTAPLPTPS
jgi:hypothetical protein